MYKNNLSTEYFLNDLKNVIAVTKEELWSGYRKHRYYINVTRFDGKGYTVYIDDNFKHVVCNRLNIPEHSCRVDSLFKAIKIAVARNLGVEYNQWWDIISYRWREGYNIDAFKVLFGKIYGNYLGLDEARVPEVLNNMDKIKYAEEMREQQKIKAMEQREAKETLANMPNTIENWKEAYSLYNSFKFKRNKLQKELYDAQVRLNTVLATLKNAQEQVNKVKSEIQHNYSDERIKDLEENHLNLLEEIKSAVNKYPEVREFIDTKYYNDIDIIKILRQK